ncbi:hypothetical protein Tco_0779978, partial [Tanacetum coccineum]
MSKSAWTEKDQIENFLKERRSNTTAGNPVKEILLKLNLPDHRILKYGGEVKEFQRSFRHSDTERLSRSEEVLKLKNFKKDATLKLFKSTNQERDILYPEEPQSPPPLDFVPEPMYPGYMPQEDEILPAEEQPLPVAATLPTADSPGYVPKSDPEEEDEDPEEDPADYPADGDDDDKEDEDEDEVEEEEHPAPADSVPPVHRMTARISIRDEPSISLPPREEVERLLALTTPPPLPLTPLSSPLSQIPSPPLPIPSPPPNSPTHIEIPESCLP